MKLPSHIARCLEALEQAGYPSYAVGGCVRDAWLGLTPADFDLCTAARPEETEAVFRQYPMVLAGKKHGTIGVILPEGVVEITTFRTEGSYADNRHPDWVKFVDRIEEDLARRDFTINAMAYSPKRGFADPFGGRGDLEKGILRAVGEPTARFQEDSLRILRGVRFSVRFRLTPEEATLKAMLAQASLMDNLARERVFSELCKLLPLVTAEDLAVFAPILGQVLPELGAEVGFQQHSPHHAYDVYTHTAQVVAHVGSDLALRWAALLHDIGKVPTFAQDATGRGHFYGHAKVGAEMADGILRRLKAPNALREEVTTLIAAHMTKTEPSKKAVRRLLSRMGWEAAEKLLTLQQADMAGKGVDNSGELAVFPVLFELLQGLRQSDSCLTVKSLAVNGHDLMALGFTGRQIGLTLNCLLEQVLEEQLENQKAALLEYAKKLTVE